MSEIIYFPSLSVGLSPYYKKDDKFLGTSDLNIRFYDDRFPEKFRHKYFLVTAGHYYKKENYREEHGMQDALVLGDSGGFQIATGAIEYKQEIIEKIFHWLENNSDLAVNIDIPPRMKFLGRRQEALDISLKNFKFFYENQSGKTKFLNVLHGPTVDLFEDWYKNVKDFEFNGWSIGGATQPTNMIAAYAVLLKNKEFNRDNNLACHFLGSTKIFDFFIYNQMQLALEEMGSPCQITTDSSTPMQFTLFGNVIHLANYKKSKWELIYFNKKVLENPEHFEKFMPCQIDCPVCTTTKLGEYKKYCTPTRINLAHHNLFMMVDTNKKIYELLKLGLGFLTEMLSPDQIKILESIKLMAQDTPNAIKTFMKHKPLYDKISRELEYTKNDEEISNSYFE